MQEIGKQNSEVVVRPCSEGRNKYSRTFGLLTTRSRRRSSPSGAHGSFDSADCETYHADLSRSLSFKMNDANGFQSFCPSDLEFKELLGRGCFGEVYKVLQKSTRAIMVLKCLYRMDPKCEADFLQEAAFMRNLCHPNVLGILGILYKDKKLHIVSEFIPCGSLRSCIESSDVVLSCVEKISIAKDVSAGMTYLHSKRIIHRDLTSCNILLREKYSDAVVADFGLALMLSRRINRQKRVPVGDPYVMAPEMIKEESYDERADIFSFGITVCEMIGRCSVDPDILPRTKNFGVDRDGFIAKFLSTHDGFDNGSLKSAASPFLEIAFKCASVDPKERPPFALLYDWLTALLSAHLAQDYSEFDQFVQEIQCFAFNTSNDDSILRSTSLASQSVTTNGGCDFSPSSCPAFSSSSTELSTNNSCFSGENGNLVETAHALSRSRQESYFNNPKNVVEDKKTPIFSRTSLSGFRRKMSFDLSQDYVTPQRYRFDLIKQQQQQQQQQQTNDSNQIKNVQCNSYENSKNVSLLDGSDVENNDLSKIDRQKSTTSCSVLLSGSQTLNGSENGTKSTTTTK